MEHRNAGVSREIPVIEREQMGDSVCQHRGDEAGIVYLHARYGMGDHQTTPLPMNPLIVRQQPESALDQRGARVGFGRRQAEPVLELWASAHIPELD